MNRFARSCTLAHSVNEEKYLEIGEKVAAEYLNLDAESNPLFTYLFKEQTFITLLFDNGMKQLDKMSSLPIHIDVVHNILAEKRQKPSRHMSSSTVFHLETIFPKDSS